MTIETLSQALQSYRDEEPDFRFEIKHDIIYGQAHVTMARGKKITRKSYDSMQDIEVEDIKLAIDSLDPIPPRPRAAMRHGFRR